MSTHQIKYSKVHPEAQNVIYYLVVKILLNKSLLNAKMIAIKICFLISFELLEQDRPA